LKKTLKWYDTLSQDNITEILSLKQQHEVFIFITASFRRAKIVIEEDDDGVMYINEDMSLADSENELLYEVMILSI
jgi:hypothetical protein